MSTGLLVAIGIVVLIVIFGYSWYVSIIKRRNEAQSALSSIDVQLRKRYDLVPNIVRLAQNFMTHEKDLMNRLTELRSQLGQPYSKDDPDQVADRLSKAQELNAGLGRIFAVAENYPELKSSETIIQAQQTFEEVEANIAAARRFYNSAVMRLNNSVKIFPGSIFANMAGVKEMPFYEIEDTAARQPVNVDDYMKPAQ